MPTMMARIWLQEPHGLQPAVLLDPAHPALQTLEAARTDRHTDPREERAGFEEALRGIEYDLVALAPSTSVRVMRHGDYPPPRGACVIVGERRYLYATGYLPSLGRNPLPASCLARSSC